jgi:hypothetical protein
MIEVSTFAMFTWNCVMWAANAARATGRSTSGAPGSKVGRVAADGVKVQRQPGRVDDFPQRLPVRVPQRLQVRRVGDVETAQRPALCDALDFGNGGLDRMIRDRAEAGEALGIRRAEFGEPRVVDAHDFDRGLGIVEPAGGAEDAIEHLGLHAVAILILHAEIGIGQTADAALAVLVEPRRRHAIGALDLAGHIQPPSRTHAVHVTEVGALLRRPHPAVGPVGHVRHALAQRGRGVGGKKIRRQPTQVNVTIRGDHLVAHGGCSNRRVDRGCIVIDTPWANECGDYGARPAVLQPSVSADWPLR